jgi:hypothetical protein
MVAMAGRAASTDSFHADDTTDRLAVDASARDFLSRTPLPVMAALEAAIHPARVYAPK